MLKLEHIKEAAYLGPEASFSEMAKDKFCEKYQINPYPRPQKTIRQVIEYVTETPEAIGVLPVENSIEGTVRESLDTLMLCDNPNIKILAEIVMPIRHCLLSRTTEFYSITGVISHPQALAQCQNFIHDELPRNLNIIETTSTAEAARSLANYNLTYAAIGSEKTAEVYNLNILKENINDDKSNQTRFVLIGEYDTEKTGRDKTSIAFSTDNRPGALLEVLNIFYKNNINLTYISSRPSKQKFGEYIFVVNFDGHIRSKKILNTLSEVKEKTTYMKFFGSYEK
ncbi:prephenate dehydratase [Spirochaetes bacterium]|uniref:prephenate dehydratase n=1 Tax=Candidatus Scatousia excrementipullorum TaxID=2840936 RepID=A0A9D9DP77_9BACT|nr:prephenate dehydratase [Candidatus Scatousia excrementipullorum]